MSAENRVADAFVRLGFEILGQRVRTPYGEIDLIVGSGDMLLAVEVKQRNTLSNAALSLGARQSQRLLQSLDYILATRPDWARPQTRLDLVIVNRDGTMRRIQDALRAM